MIKLSSLTLVKSSCSCDTCKSYCIRPCWPTPAQAQALIDAGYAASLMMDWWVGNSFKDNDSDIYILCPATKGRGGDRALNNPTEIPCIMQNKKGLCKLHDAGLKPLEGSHVSCKAHKDERKLHEAVAESWNNQEAQDLVQHWKELVGFRF